MPRWRCGAVLLAAIFLSSPAVFAQTGASIEGTVADSTGGALPGVTVQVTHTDTGVTRTVDTDADGRYRLRELALGDYRVEATLQGFRSAIRSGVVLTIGRTAVVDFEMSLGEVSETISVTGDAPLVDTTSGGVASLVSREQMADLPLNARDFSQLISLQAGTVQVQGEVSGSNAGQAAGARISISGARPSANVFILDGTEIQTAYGTLPAGVGGATLGLEAVQEFKIQTNNYSARYGRSVGGTVVAATRSGTNAFSGTGYWYHRNDAFDARNFFATTKPEFRRNQMGASFGGPVLKSRTFFFANYEVLRERLPRPLSAIVPSNAAREGILPGRTVTVDPRIKPYLALWPVSNGRDFGDGTAEYTHNAERPTDQYYTSIRVDHNFSANGKIFARYTRDVSELSNPGAVPLFDTSQLSRNHYTTVEHSQVMSAHLVNQARFGFTRTVVGSHPVAVNQPDASLDFYSGRGFGTLTVTGLADLSGGGGDNTDTVDAAIMADDLTFSTGRNTLNVGASLSILAFDRVSWGERFSGQFEFGSLVDFLTNARPTRLRISGFNADPVRNFRNKLMSFYVQDDINLRNNFVINAGMRYDYLTSPTETEDRLANLRQITDPAPTVGAPYYKNPGGFISPRLGVVWDPSGKGTLAIHAGFGLFHEPLHMKSYIVSMTRQPPFWTEIDPAAAQLVGLFPDVTSQLERLTKESPQAIHVFEYEANNPYSMQGSLSVQRQLSSNLVLEVGYVGSRGVHLPGRKEWAVPVRTVVNGESFFPASAGYVNPTFSRLNYYDTSATSWYHALKTTVTRRFSNGLHFQGAYTWSKSMDTESATVLGELDATSVSDPYDPKRDWGLSSFHVPHTFTASASYHLPWGEQMSGIAGAFAKDWQISGILTAAGGRPFTVLSNSQITHPLLRTNTRPDLIDGGDTNPILGNPTQWFDPLQFVPQRTGYLGSLGRNTLVGPGLFKVDFSVVKEVAFGSRRSLQFRAEVFNVTNRANFGQPANVLFNARGVRLATAGLITNTVTTARQGQIAIRLAF